MVYIVLCAVYKLYKYGPTVYVMVVMANKYFSVHTILIAVFVVAMATYNPTCAY